VKKTAVESVTVAKAETRPLITRRGRPMARLVPPGPPDADEGLAGVEGWLEDSDPFFDRVDEAVAARAGHRPRAYGGRRRGSR
jgi:hypothetical protein